MQMVTTIVAAGPAAAIVLSEDEVVALGGGKRAAVRVSIGGVTERLRVASMGGRYLIGMRREVRESFGVSAGDIVEAVIELDDQPREVEVPDDLASALVAAGARARFDALAYTHRKEIVAGVESAKRAETRTRRIEAAVAGLSGTAS